MTPKGWRAIYRILIVTALLSVGIYAGDIPILQHLFDSSYQFDSFLRFLGATSFIGCIAIKFYVHRAYKCPFCGYSLDFGTGWAPLALINAAISFIRFINIKYCSACESDLTDSDIDWAPNDKNRRNHE